MELFRILSILITLAAVFSYLNNRFIHLPTVIGIMFISLVVSLTLIAAHECGLSLDERIIELVKQIDFNQTVLHGLLAFLLFAGALHVEINDLAEQKWVITLLATAGTVISTGIVAALTWVGLRLIGLDIPAVYCLLFGALISPTDPIAVLGLLTSAGVPKGLESQITGESLFNDGIGVVLFLVLLEVATGTHEVTVGDVATLLAQEAVGGAVWGLVTGVIAYQMLRSVDNYQVEVLVTLALVMGTYALAEVLHLSGPIAIVVAGLFIGNHGRMFAMSDRTREHLDAFWELIDEILNAVLFVLIGLEVLALSFTKQYLAAGLVAIPIVLLARVASVSVPVALLRRYRDFSPNVIRILTWGGLRGGISVALALALPVGAEREVIVAITYAVVVFSIFVQGLTLRWVIRSSRLDEAQGAG